MNLDTATLLLVEDNEDDVFIFQRAYRQAKLPHPLQVARDGQEALDYLRGEGRFADRALFPLPFAVLLDLKLPFMHGLEVLQAIRSQPALAPLCVVVLTSSAESRDLKRARELGAQAYLVKPPEAAVLAGTIAAMRTRVAGEASAPPRAIAGDLFALGSNPPI